MILWFIVFLIRFRTLLEGPLWVVKSFWSHVSYLSGNICLANMSNSIWFGDCAESTSQVDVARWPDPWCDKPRALEFYRPCNELVRGNSRTIIMIKTDMIWNWLTATEWNINSDRMKMINCDQRKIMNSDWMKMFNNDCVKIDCDWMKHLQSRNENY